MNLSIEQRTRLAFEAPVDYTIQHLHLTPQDGFGQRVRKWEIRVNGKMQPHADAYGNLVHTLVVDEPHRLIDITVSGEVETGLDLPPPAEALPLQVYLRATRLTAADAAMAEFAEAFGMPGTGLGVSRLQALMHAVRDRIVLCTTPPGIAPTAAGAFASKSGSSQDMAHVFIACCRHLEVPARYVSGYLFSVSCGVVANHAWADVWINDQWQSFDINSGLRTNGIHVRLASGLDARDASPITMVRRDAETSTSFRVQAHGMGQSQQ